MCVGSCFIFRGWGLDEGSLIVLLMWCGMWCGFGLCLVWLLWRCKVVCGFFDVFVVGFLCCLGQGD